MGQDVRISCGRNLFSGYGEGRKHVDDRNEEDYILNSDLIPNRLPLQVLKTGYLMECSSLALV